MSNEEFRDLVITGLVGLALGLAFVCWIADKLGKQDAEKRYVVDEEDFCAVPSAAHQAKVAAQHCAKVNAKRSSIENLPGDYLCPISGLTGAQFKAMSEQAARVQP